MIFVGVLLSAFVAQQIGVAAIFGAFIMGLIMPRRAGLTEDVTRRIDDFVTFVLLPLFFVITGLRTEIGSIDRVELWLITLGLIVVAVVGKWLGAMSAARYGGFSWRESAAVGALMNTRGLTELIVLNIGLDLGLISPTLFTMLVVMALVTTFMAGPALRLIDPHGRLSAPAEEELQAALREVAPGDSLVETRHSILVAPQDARNMDSLLSIAGPLASSQPPRDLILARLIVPQRSATGLAADDRELRAATEDLQQRREALTEAGLSTRVIAFTTPDAGEDLVRLGRDERIDLVLVDGRRPLLGDGIPKGEIGARPRRRRERRRRARRARARARSRSARRSPSTCPFGGAEHDWAALELGAWIAHARNAPLRLHGRLVRRRAGDARREPAARERVARRAAADGDRGRAGARQPGPRRDPEGERRRACSWSASPTGGATRASARSAPRSSSPRRRRCCSSVAARAAACSRRATT